jgi:hypothetical protein
MEGQTQLMRILEAMGSKDRRLRIKPITPCFVALKLISQWTKNSKRWSKTDLVDEKARLFVETGHRGYKDETFVLGWLVALA